MKRIIKIGMDVHSTTYTLCAAEPRLGEPDYQLGSIRVTADPRNIVDFIEHIKKKLGDREDTDVVCGYEAGCLGYSLYHALQAKHIPCVILAPSTMLSPQGKRVKTDTRDAEMICQCLCHGGYQQVHVPTMEDEEVKEYIRMREDHKEALKKVKQQIQSFCLRHGYSYTEATKWTAKHLKWLNNLELDGLLKDILTEYMITYRNMVDRIEQFDAKIEELGHSERYREKVKKLGCFLGIKTHSALAILTETGDFTRFAKGNIYGSYLGLTPGEQSSGTHIVRTGISKAGNSHLRKILVEAAQSICKGVVGYKCKALKARQKGNTSEVIAYADKANLRLRKKYYRLVHQGKRRNVAVTAVARELACFIWGMMTDHIDNAA